MPARPARFNRADPCATTEVIAAADERNMAMIFTGVRHFRH